MGQNKPAGGIDADIVLFYSDNGAHAAMPGNLGKYHKFEGGHFFINESLGAICEMIRQKLA